MHVYNASIWEMEVRESEGVTLTQKSILFYFWDSVSYNTDCTQIHYIVRQGINSWFSCLYLPSAEMIDKHHHM